MDPSTDELVGFLYNHKPEFIIGIIFLVLQVIPPIALRFLKKADRTTERNDTHLLKRLQSSKSLVPLRQARLGLVVGVAGVGGGDD
jgi:hypothetical protein